MEYEIKLDESFSQPKVVIYTDKVNDEVNQLVQKLLETEIESETGTDPGNKTNIITGQRGEKIVVLDPDNIFNIFANGGKVFANTTDGEYRLKLRLYELEERLNPSQFVRISNSEIINLKKVDNFDLSMTGTICVELENRETSYVSRRYVSRVKQILGL